MNDIIYICRDGKNEELRYSLRSVERNFPHRLVIIYGGKPDDIEPDAYHRIKQEGATKWEKVRNTLKLVCQNNGITPDVKFMGRRRPATIGALVSTADESWKTQPIGHTIREKFKQPSIWEVRHG